MPCTCHTHEDATCAYMHGRQVVDDVLVPVHTCHARAMPVRGCTRARMPRRGRRPSGGNGGRRGDPRCRRGPSLHRRRRTTPQRRPRAPRRRRRRRFRFRHSHRCRQPRARLRLCPRSFRRAPSPARHVSRTAVQLSRRPPNRHTPSEQCGRGPEAAQQRAGRARCVRASAR